MALPEDPAALEGRLSLDEATSNRVEGLSSLGQPGEVKVENGAVESASLLVRGFP
jgi:hypothetical protein